MLPSARFRSGETCLLLATLIGGLLCCSDHGSAAEEVAPRPADRYQEHSRHRYAASPYRRFKDQEERKDEYLWDQEQNYESEEDISEEDREEYPEEESSRDELPPLPAASLSRVQSQLMGDPYLKRRASLSAPSSSSSSSAQQDLDKSASSAAPRRYHGSGGKRDYHHSSPSLTMAPGSISVVCTVKEPLEHIVWLRTQCPDEYDRGDVVARGAVSHFPEIFSVSVSGEDGQFTSTLTILKPRELLAGGVFRCEAWPHHDEHRRHRRSSPNTWNGIVLGGAAMIEECFWNSYGRKYRALDITGDSRASNGSSKIARFDDGNALEDVNNATEHQLNTQQSPSFHSFATHDIPELNEDELFLSNGHHYHHSHHFMPHFPFRRPISDVESHKPSPVFSDHAPTYGKPDHLPQQPYRDSYMSSHKPGRLPQGIEHSSHGYDNIQHPEHGPSVHAYKTHLSYSSPSTSDYPLSDRPVYQPESSYDKRPGSNQESGTNLYDEDLPSKYVTDSHDFYSNHPFHGQPNNKKARPNVHKPLYSSTRPYTHEESYGPDKSSHPSHSESYKSQLFESFPVEADQYPTVPDTPDYSTFKPYQSLPSKVKLDRPPSDGPIYEGNHGSARPEYTEYEKPQLSYPSRDESSPNPYKKPGKGSHQSFRPTPIPTIESEFDDEYKPHDDPYPGKFKGQYHDLPAELDYPPPGYTESHESQLPERNPESPHQAPSPAEPPVHHQSKPHPPHGIRTSGYHGSVSVEPYVPSSQAAHTPSYGHPQNYESHYETNHHISRPHVHVQHAHHFLKEPSNPPYHPKYSNEPQNKPAINPYDKTPSHAYQPQQSSPKYEQSPNQHQYSHSYHNTKMPLMTPQYQPQYENKQTNQPASFQSWPEYLNEKTGSQSFYPSSPQQQASNPSFNLASSQREESAPPVLKEQQPSVQRLDPRQGPLAEVPAPTDLYRPEQPRQEQPRQDPFRQDPPRQEQPRQDPPRQEYLRQDALQLGQPSQQSLSGHNPSRQVLINTNMLQQGDSNISQVPTTPARKQRVDEPQETIDPNVEAKYSDESAPRQIHFTTNMLAHGRSVNAQSRLINFDETTSSSPMMETR